MNKTIVFRKQQSAIEPAPSSNFFKKTTSKSPPTQKSLVEIFKKPIQKGEQ